MGVDHTMQVSRLETGATAIAKALNVMAPDIALYRLLVIITPRLDFEQTLRHMILTLVSILTLLLRNSAINPNSSTFLVDFFVFHAFGSVLLRLRWPDDNIYFSLMLPDVDLRTKLILSCSSAPLLLISRTLLDATTRRLPMVLRYCKQVSLSTSKIVLRVVILTVLSPLRLVYWTLALAAKTSTRLGLTLTGALTSILSSCVTFVNQASRIAYSSGSSFLLQIIHVLRLATKSLSNASASIHSRYTGLAFEARAAPSIGGSYLASHSTRLLTSFETVMHRLFERIPSAIQYMTVSVTESAIATLDLASSMTKQITGKINSTTIPILSVWIMKFRSMLYSSVHSLIRVLFRGLQSLSAFLVQSLANRKTSLDVRVFFIIFVYILASILLYRWILTHVQRNDMDTRRQVPRQEAHCPSETSAKVAAATTLSTAMDIRWRFSIAAHCAAAKAPKFIACEGLRQKEDTLRQYFEARISKYETRLQALVTQQRNTDQPFHASSVFNLVQGLETARLALVHSEIDIEEVARSWAFERATSISNLQSTVGLQSGLAKLYDGDLDLYDILQLKEETIGTASPLLLPSSSSPFRDELEAELNAMELMQSTAEQDLDLDVDDVGCEIDDDLIDMPQSPRLSGRRSLFQAHSTRNEEKRLGNVVVRRTFVREGMELFTEAVRSRRTL